MASGTTKSVEVVLPIVSSPTPTPKLKRKRATYFDDFEVSPVQTSSEHVLGREHDAFEPSAVDPGPANSTLSVDTLEQLPPPPNCRDVLIFLWRSRLPIGKEPEEQAPARQPQEPAEEAGTTQAPGAEEGKEREEQAPAPQPQEPAEEAGTTQAPGAEEGKEREEQASAVVVSPDGTSVSEAKETVEDPKTQPQQEKMDEVKATVEEPRSQGQEEKQTHATEAPAVDKGNLPAVPQQEKMDEVKATVEEPRSQGREANTCDRSTGS